MAITPAEQVELLQISDAIELVGPGFIELPPRKNRAVAILQIARRKPLGSISLVFLLFLAFVAIFQGFVANHDPLSTHPLAKLQGPGSTYYFGTDELGRDVFSRMVYGTRTALLAGLLATSVGVGCGTLIGLISGYFGGLVDLLLQRAMDTVMAIPGLILLLALVTVL